VPSRGHYPAISFHALKTPSSCHARKFYSGISRFQAYWCTSQYDCQNRRRCNDCDCSVFIRLALAPSMVMYHSLPYLPTCYHDNKPLAREKCRIVDYSAGHDAHGIAPALRFMCAVMEPICWKRRLGAEKHPVAQHGSASVRLLDLGAWMRADDHTLTTM
jgi:hypothetical protein